MTTVAPSALRAAITAVRVDPRSQIVDVEHDPPSIDAAVGVDEVGRCPHAGELLAREARGIADEREDRPDPDLSGHGRSGRRRRMGG